MKSPWPTEKLEEICEFIKKKIEDFDFEVRQIYDKLVKPNWEKDGRRYYSTLYGFMMYFFSIIDLLSAYEKGTEKKQTQTQRMEEFLTHYLKYGPKESKLAVQIWRHKLIHTSEPRRLIGSKSNLKYYWLLHWSNNELPNEQNMRFQQSSDPKILNICLFSLIKDLKSNLGEYFKNLKFDKVEEYQKFLENQKFYE
ncbi:MAG: hypothetical protein QXX45_03875 [Candidatus Aenigmatarchaeota archaeon]